MKKNLFNLTKFEKRKILEMHYSAMNKNLILEKGEKPINIEIGEPVLVGTTNSAETYCTKITITGVFGNMDTLDIEELTTNIQSDILKTIDQNEILKESYDNSSLKITEISAIGGASNNIDGKKTVYDLNNDFTPAQITDEVRNIEKFNATEKQTEQNRNLAIKRAKNLLDKLETKVFPELKILTDYELPTIEGFIINTGGYSDTNSERDWEIYKEPGQFVKIIMTLCGIKITTSQVYECYEDIKIRISYDRDDDELNQPDHVCNNAMFEVYANDVKLTNGVDSQGNYTEYANLNNSKPSNEKPQYTPINDFDKYFQKKKIGRGYKPIKGGKNRGGSREATFTVDRITAENFLNNKNFEQYRDKLVIKLKCVNPGGFKSKNWGYGCHKSSVKIEIFKEKIKGLRTELMEPSKKFTPTNKNTYKEVANLFVCNTKNKLLPK